MSVVSGLVWCLVILFAQLLLLHYIDIRVAAMPRLKEPPQEPSDVLVQGQEKDTAMR